MNDDLRNYYIEQEVQNVFMLDLETDLFSNISFPTLPKNFVMQTSKIDYPEWANKNPNNSMLVDPQNEINSSYANDIAHQLFNSEQFTGGNKQGLKMTNAQNVMDAFMPDFGNPILEWFYMNCVNNSLNEDTPSQTGKEVKVQDIKDRNLNFTKVNTDIQKAITTYIMKSLTVIQPLIEMVKGQGAGSYMTSIKKAINTANRISVKNVSDWLEANIDSQVVGSNKKEAEIRELESKAKYREHGTVFLQGIVKNLKDDQKKYINVIVNDANRVEDQNDLDNFVRKYSNKWRTYNEFYSDWKTKDPNKQKFTVVISDTSESVEYTSKKHLNESAAGKNYGVNYDEIYQELYTKLSAEISENIGPRQEWVCMKDIEKQMIELKDAATKEITEKIKLVCNTAENSSKLKVKWRFKESGLVNMWTRYAQDLNQRIAARMGTLTGQKSGISDGSAEFVEQFLTTTYPQIIAMMLTYRCAFEQMNYFIKKNYVPTYTLEDMDEIVMRRDDSMNSTINNRIIGFDNTVY